MITQGQIISHFRILEHLGRGGMGEVWLAEDIDLKRLVAIKMLPLEASNNLERLARFQREAQIVAALNHPNIVTIYSVEREEDRYFLSMEFVEGRPLDTMIPQGGLPVESYFDVALPLTEAVSAAHDRGVVHRDLKPQNVMMTRDGRVKVLDFGLAKLLSGRRPSAVETDAETDTITCEGRVMGTVAYMAPEQAEGLGSDHRSDVFSLGVMLYEMATGDHPFRRETNLSTLTSILRDEPPPVNQLKGELPASLGRLIRRCLDKDPRTRFQSALDLRTALGDVQFELETGIPAPIPETPALPAVRDPNETQEVRPPESGRRKLGIVVGSVVAGLAVVVGGLLWMRRGEEPQPAPAPPATAPAVEPPPLRPAPRRSDRTTLAVLPFANLGSDEDAFLTDGISREISSQLGWIPDLGVISRRSTLRFADSRLSTRRIGEELGADYVLDGTVQWDHEEDGESRVRVTPELVRIADDTQVWSDSFDRVLDDVFSLQTDIGNAVRDQLGLALLVAPRGGGPAAPTESMEAWADYLEGMSLAEEHDDSAGLDAAVAAFEQAVVADPDFANAYAELGLTHMRIYELGIDASPERLAVARAVADQALELQPGLPEAQAVQGLVRMWGEHDLRGALEDLQAAALARPNDAGILAPMAECLRDLGQTDTALRAFDRVLEVDPADALAAGAAADTYTWLRRYDEARPLHATAVGLAPDRVDLRWRQARNALLWRGAVDEASSMVGAVRAAGDPELPWIHFELYRLGRDYERALEALDGAPATVVTPLDPVPKSLLEARIRRLMGNQAASRSAFRDAAATLERLAARSPQDPGVRSSLGLAYAGQGRAEDALREGRRALELAPLHHVPFELGPALIERMAMIHLLLGDDERAIEQLDRLLGVPAFVSRTWLAIDPLWDPLRENPRFQRLVGAGT